VSDVLLQNGGTVVHWLMQNGQYSSGNVLSTGAAGWQVAGIGDFNGDAIWWSFSIRAPRPRARRRTASVNASTKTALNEFYRVAFRKKV
jgi:hypothetical protein